MRSLLRKQLFVASFSAVLFSFFAVECFAGNMRAAGPGNERFLTMSPDEAIVGLTQISSAVPDDDESVSSASPDGRVIVYEKFSDDGDLSLSEIWVRDSETGKSRVLTTGRMPVFSPDGRKIAFVTYDDSVDPRYNYTILWTMRPDGSNKTMVTQEGFGELWHPQFSPDGRRLVFQCVTGDKEDFDLYVIGTDGSNLLQLTCNESYDGEPYWASDGIYFISDRGHEPGDYARWSFEYDGGSRSRHVTRSQVDDSSPMYHEVKRGENIVRIAERYGVTVRNLVKWNHLQSMTLKPGMRLRICE